MQVNLIALCTEETKGNLINEICPLVQQKLNVSTVEILSTTVFSDLYSINMSLARHLNFPSVIVADFDNNIDLNMVKNIVISKLGPSITDFEAGSLIYNNSNFCLIVNSGKFNFFEYLEPQTLCHVFKKPLPIAFLKVFGLDKTNILQKIAQISNVFGFEYTVYVSNMEGEISVSNPNNLPSFDCQKFVRELYELFSAYYYADNDKPMLQILDEILTVRNARICVADILTSGYFERFLKEGLPNFEEHVVEFDTLSTLEDVAINLHVGSDFLATHKKESVELCYEMAVSMTQHLDANFALVLSGTYKVPFIGVGDEQAVHVYKYGFDHSSDYITQIICRQAVFKIIKKLQQN